MKLIVDDIEVDYRVSVLKPLHAKWLVELYSNIHVQRWEERNCCQWLEKSGHLQRYQTRFKWSSIFGSICRYMPSGLISPVTWKPEFTDPFFRRAWLFLRENPGKWGWLRPEWEPDGDSDNCSEPETDDDGNAFDAFNGVLWLVISKKVSILLEYVFYLL